MRESGRNLPHAVDLQGESKGEKNTGATTRASGKILARRYGEKNETASPTRPLPSFGNKDLSGELSNFRPAR